MIQTNKQTNDENCIAAGCSLKLVGAKSGIIQSPGFGSNYPPNQECTTVVEAESPFSVTFDPRFDLRSGDTLTVSTLFGH